MNYFEEQVLEMINDKIRYVENKCEGRKKQMDVAQVTLIEYTNEYNKHKKEIEKLTKYLSDYKAKLSKIEELEKKKKKDRIKELADARIKENGGWISFNGAINYCEDDCKEWDGESKRCNCGDRCDDWRYESDDDYVYAESY